MGPPVRVPVVVAACLLLVATASAMAVGAVSLTADGPFYLVRILGTDDLLTTNARLFGNALRQAPVLLAARSGLTETYGLSVLLGVGQIVLPAVVWSVAIVLSRANLLAFAAVTMTAGLSAGMTWLANVSESVLALPLTLLVAVLLWQPRPWRVGHAALAVAASVVLVASYESALVTGALLAIWSVWRARISTARPDRWGGITVAVASVLSMVVAVGGALTGKGSTNAQSSLYFMASGDPWPFYVAFLGGLLLLAALAARNGGLRWTLLGLGGVATVLAVSGWTATPAVAFQARGGAAMAASLAVLFLWALWLGERLPNVPDTARSGAAWLVVVPVVFVAALTLANLGGVARWTCSVDAFRTEVDRARGIVPEDEVLPPDRRVVVWDWTSSSLSLIVRRDAGAGILVDRNPSWTPFPPAVARTQLDDVYTWRATDWPATCVW
jgi:hypothetical protein